MKECHLYMYMICKMVKSHFPMVEIPFPDISSLKTQSVDCFSVLIFQDNFANTVFHSNFVSALCEGWLQCITSVMQKLLTLQNHRCKTWSLHFAQLKSDKFYSTQIKMPWSLYLSWVIQVVGPNLENPFCTQPCSETERGSEESTQMYLTPCSGGESYTNWELRHLSKSVIVYPTSCFCKLKTLSSINMHIMAKDSF